MDNAQKAIMIGVGLFITIIIIAAVMLITGIGTGLVNKGTNKAGNVAAQLDQTELEQYDNKDMSGAQVLSAVRKYWTDTNIVVALGVKSTSSHAVAIKFTTPNATGKTAGLSGEYQLKGTFVEKDDTGSSIVENTNHSSDSISNYANVSGKSYISPSTQYTAYIMKLNGTQ